MCGLVRELRYHIRNNPCAYVLESSIGSNLKHNNLISYEDLLAINLLVERLQIRTVPVKPITHMPITRPILRSTWPIPQ
jgi:hypothetical protein